MSKNLTTSLNNNYQIITNPGNKLKIDTLEKCEDVLKKLYEKVEGAPIGSGSKGSNRARAAAAGPDTPRSPSPPTPQVREQEKAASNVRMS